MAATVRFSWTDEQGQGRRGEGVSRDVSVHGIFIESMVCPRVAAAIQMEVVLPKGEGQLSSLRLKSAGEVVRVESASAANRLGGFGVQAKQFLLRSSQPDGTQPKKMNSRF